MGFEEFVPFFGLGVSCLGILALKNNAIPHHIKGGGDVTIVARLDAQRGASRE